MFTRSQNRIESYHQLRAAIAQVGGKKQLIGKTDLEVAIANQCGRLLANAIIYYNSAILSCLLDKHLEVSTPNSGKSQAAFRTLFSSSPMPKLFLDGSITCIPCWISV